MCVSVDVLNYRVLLVCFGKRKSVRLMIIDFLCCDDIYKISGEDIVMFDVISVK